MDSERMTAEQHADNLDAWADREAQHQPTGELMDASKCLRRMSVELRDEVRHIRKLNADLAAKEAELAEAVDIIEELRSPDYNDSLRRVYDDVLGSDDASASDVYCTEKRADDFLGRTTQKGPSDG